MVFEVEGVQGEHNNNEKEGGEKMKKKTWVSMLALVVLFSLSIIPVAHGERTEKEIKQLKEGAEIQELRLYIKEGKIVYVEPINLEGYKIKDLPDLRGENIREGTAVMIGQDSPVCTYWYYYLTRSGWEKICLY